MVRWLFEIYCHDVFNMPWKNYNNTLDNELVISEIHQGRGSDQKGKKTYTFQCHLILSKCYYFLVLQTIKRRKTYSALETLGLANNSSNSGTPYIYIKTHT